MSTDFCLHIGFVLEVESYIWESHSLYFLNFMVHVLHNNKNINMKKDSKNFKASKLGSPLRAFKAHMEGIYTCTYMTWCSPAMLCSFPCRARYNAKINLKLFLTIIYRHNITVPCDKVLYIYTLTYLLI